MFLQLTLDELTAPGAVIDISHKITQDTYNYRLSLADLEEFEGKYGEIPPKALVVAKARTKKKSTLCQR
jgi:kynurenine formamidase